MKRKRAEAVIEAVLFTMGESVEIGRLADVIEEDVKTLKDILKGMEERYAREDRGITLVRFEDSVQLCTKEDMYEYLVKIAKVPKKMSLTDTVLETLSIIAYKQPVTRAEIERVRGVNGTVPALLRRGEAGGAAGAEPCPDRGVQAAGRGRGAAPAGCLRLGHAYKHKTETKPHILLKIPLEVRP